MWNEVFMTYLNSPSYTLYNKKSRLPFGCLLLYYFVCIKESFQGFSFYFPQIKNAQPLGLSI